MKHKLLTRFTGLFLAGSLLVPAIGMAQSTTTTAQINSLTALMQQIQSLQSQIRALHAQTATEFSAFLTTLSLGSKGDAVLALQALLAANPDIYPEGLITGYFGKATENALKRFQKQNGLEQVGVMGPKTRGMMNQLLKQNQIALETSASSTATSTNNGQGKRPCAIVPPGHLIAPGWLRKQGGVKPIVPACQTLPMGIASKLNGNWSPGTTTATTTPDATAPVVSNLKATSTASTTASITWNTNENATSTLWYSTTSPINTTTALRLDNNTWKTSHVYDLLGLTASTTYNYLLKVSDIYNNSATSAEYMFTTLGN